MKSLAAIHQSYGKASEVLKTQEIEVASPKEGEVLIKLVRASINPSDMGMIGGSYGRLRALPAIGGREAIGEIAQLGANVENLEVGDLVRIPEADGVWVQYSTHKADELLKLPKGLPADTLAMAFVNPPTALCILNNFCDLKAGDWLIQNGAGSALGYFMIQMCKARGIKTINVLRNAESKRAQLEEIGADIVVDENDFDAKKIKEQSNGGALLGLNQIGANSVWNMIKAMKDSATIVTVGGMLSEPIRFPTRFLIFNDLTLKGFWWDKWQRTHTKDEVKKVYEEIFEMIAKGILKAPVDSVYEIKDANQAVAQAEKSSRLGKVMLKF